MPLPLYTDQTTTQMQGRANPNTTQFSQQAGAPGTTSSSSNNNNTSHATTTSFAQSSFPSAMDAQGQRLSKEEADRLYEERMEDEYASQRTVLEGRLI
ncbi:hypothetical protein BDW60DRAFT_205329 [Aspergillus nidulans var. acristatus]